MPRGSDRVELGLGSVELQWRDLAGVDRVDLWGLDGVLDGLLTEGARRGGLLCATDMVEGTLVGVGGITANRADAAYGAVAVRRGWRRRGLGTVLARRVSQVARNAGVGHLTCRCNSVRLEDAARTAALFDEVCVNTVRVAFQQIIVLRLTV